MEPFVRHEFGHWYGGGDNLVGVGVGVCMGIGKGICALVFAGIDDSPIRTCWSSWAVSDRMPSSTATPYSARLGIGMSCTFGGAGGSGASMPQLSVLPSLGGIGGRIRAGGVPRSAGQPGLNWGFLAEHLVVVQTCVRACCRLPDYYRHHDQVVALVVVGEGLASG